MKDKYAIINSDLPRHKTMRILVSVFLSSLFLVFMQAVIQNGTDYNGYLSYIISPLIPILNLLPIFFLMVIFYYLFENMKAAFICTAVPFFVLLAVNYYKVFFRDEPFVPSDLILASEATNIIQNYKLTIPWPLVIGFLLTCLFYILYVRKIKFSRYRWYIRAIGVVAAVSCLFVSYVTVYKNSVLYDSLKSYANEFHSVSIVNNKGFLYSFLSKPSVKDYPKPENYSPETVSAMLSDNQYFPTEKLPNIVAIMSESFFNIEKAENAEFYEGMEPLENFNALKSEAFYGEMVVPGFAGATASTECEFLTGVNLFLADSSMPAVYNAFFRKEFYSLPTVFKNMGFRTSAIHPGHKWFYNRQNAYKYMGFDTFQTIDDVPPDAERVNYYVSDKVTADMIINDYKAHLSKTPDEGYFGFTVTIQNHGPYPDVQGDRPLRVVKHDNVDDKSYYSLNNYVNGLYDSDVLLGRVKEYISTLDTPTVLVFFGDHLPFLGAENEGFKAVGLDVESDTPETMARKHSVPYMFWMNDAARKDAAENGRKIKTGENSLISSNFLPAELFDYIGCEKPPFFDFLYKLRQRVSVIAPGYFVSGGQFTKELSEENQRMLDDYRQMQYYNINDYSKQPDFTKPRRQ